MGTHEWALIGTLYVQFAKYKESAKKFNYNFENLYKIHSFVQVIKGFIQFLTQQTIKYSIQSKW